ncbi:MAG: hypothetical protein LBU32_29785 [Clostridiales bacterium]|jgi:hypothetical protein|nr:hypothetical protein [Clostridiales bacterium]
MTKSTIKKYLRQMLVVYPTMFASMLFVIGAVNSSNEGANSAFSLVMDEHLPFGSSGFSIPDPVSSKEVAVNGINYVFVYEKETEQYLAYKGFDCLGCVVLDYGVSINDFGGAELLGMVEPISLK